MVLTESAMQELGVKAPDFSLVDTISGETLTLSNLKSDIATVIMFICNHCPFVVHIQEQLIEITRQYKAKGIQFIAISSNDVESYPEDSPELMKALAEKLQFSFPYLYDSTQQVAKQYGAQCTPDFFIFDKALLSVYRGRFDDSTPGNHKPVTGADLTQALDAILQNQAVNTDQKPSMGCNIKWK